MPATGRVMSRYRVPAGRPARPLWAGRSRCGVRSRAPHEMVAISRATLCARKGCWSETSACWWRACMFLHDSCDIARRSRAAEDLVHSVPATLTYDELFARLADEALADDDTGLQVVRRQGTMLSTGIGITEHQAEAAVPVGRYDEALAILDAFPYDALEGSTLVSFAAPCFDIFLQRGELDAAARPLAQAMQRAAAMVDAQFVASTRIRAAQLPLAARHLDNASATCQLPRRSRTDATTRTTRPKACIVWILGQRGLPGHRPRHSPGAHDPAARPLGHAQIVQKTAPWPIQPRSQRWPAPRPGQAQRRVSAQCQVNSRDSVGTTAVNITSLPMRRITIKSRHASRHG